MNPLLKIKNVSKNFGGFAALTEHRRKPLRKALERLFSAQSRTAARA